ncbi:hypothetical protein [[Kitasatospora] papulosa]|uniref:hypothetical protein n=1 Tax=[Kitasatospora] papulosa TaxID=1464011 RepID=UPI0036A66527
MTTTDRSSLMPQYPHRPIVQAMDRLTEQMKRVADALDTPAEEVDAALPPDNGARLVPRVVLPGAEEHAQAFQQWLHDNTPKPWPPYKMCSASIDGAFGRPLGPCVLRYQHDGPVHVDASGTTWEQRQAADAVGPCCWHTEPGSLCDWDVCRQPERLAAGDAGTDPAL